MAHHRQCQWQTADRPHQRLCLLSLMYHRCRCEVSQHFKSFRRTEFGDDEHTVMAELMRNLRQTCSDEMRARRAADLKREGILNLPGVINDEQQPQRLGSSA